MSAVLIEAGGAQPPEASAPARNTCSDAIDPQASDCFPVPAGPCHVNGSKLTVHGRDGVLVVQAPRGFLSTLLEFCDGRHALAEVERLANERWGGKGFERFLRDMLSAEVLVDATELLWRSLEASAPSVDTTRTTFHGFAAAALTCDRLAPILDVLEVGFSAFDRSEPTADKTIRHVTLVLTCPADGTEAQACDLARDSRQNLVLRPLASPTTDWLRAVAQPEQWADAAGLLIFSIEGGSRVHSSVPAEIARTAAAIGAGLQSAHQIAASLGVEIVPVMDFDRRRMACLPALVGHRIIGCAALGERLTSEEAAKRAQHRQVRLGWMETHRAFGSHVVRATLSSPSLENVTGWGRSGDARTACAIAVSEAAERLAYRRLGTCVTAPAGTLDRFIHPTELAHYTPAQYRNTALAIAPFRPEAEYLWTQAHEWSSGQAWWVPGDFVYHGAAVEGGRKGPVLMPSTSSGCATDVSLEVAIERAACEVIERDAFLRHWLTQCPGRTIARASLSRALVQRIARLADHACQVSMQVLDGALGPVMLASITSPDLHFCAIGTATGTDAFHALERALTEAETAAFARLAGASARRVRAVDVRTPRDHSDLHAAKRHCHRANFFSMIHDEVSLAQLERAWPTTLKQRMQGAGTTRRMLWIDMTVPDGPLDLARRPLRIVRAVIPGCIPLAFGFDAVPRGGLPFVSARGRFPHPLS